MIWDSSMTEAWAWTLGISRWKLQFIENFLSISLQPYRPLLEERSKVKLQWAEVSQAFTRVSAFHKALWSFPQIIHCCAAALHIYPHQTKSPAGLSRSDLPRCGLKNATLCMLADKCPYTDLWLKGMLARRVRCSGGSHARWKGLVKNLKNQKRVLASPLQVVRGREQAL